jgi:hypothetical protein
MEVYEFAGPMGNDYVKIDEHLQTRYDWLWMHNLDTDVEEAFRVLSSKGIVANWNAGAT